MIDLTTLLCVGQIVCAEWAGVGVCISRRRDSVILPLTYATHSIQVAVVVHTDKVPGRHGEETDKKDLSLDSYPVKA